MPEQTIICPNCGKRIPVSEALTHQIESELRKNFESKAKERDKEAQANFEKKLSAETARAEKQARIDFEKRLSEEQSRLEKQVQKIAEEKFSGELTDLKKQLREKEKQSVELKRQQADVQKLQNQLASREKSIEAEIKQKVEKALRKAESETEKRIEAEHRNRELQLEKKLSDAKRQASELKRKLEQSSPQAQGEVIEIELENVLRRAFPEDEIEPIAKGKSGADVLQRVYNAGQYCGMIIWESKNTQNWSKAWLGQLRSNQRRAKAELAVLVSMALPKDVSHFAQVEGVWVTEFPLVLGVATALRTNLAQAALMKQSSKGRHEKMELLYEYLSSTEFKHRIEALVEAFRSMQDDLNKERQTMERQWAKREKQIQLVVQNVTGMYGAMQAIVGQSLPKIRRLELPSASES
ncbi:MAG TPA: DUF2130 domain-containing protein [Candidatus Hypogeohydataceae bacterium YC40]